jgi:2'-5' RNA ligase
MSTRTFIAVSLPDHVRDRAIALVRQLQPAAGDVKWTARENLHWTLQFLGDVDDTDLPEVCDAVAAAAANVAAFDIEVRGAGAFPSGSRPRTLWLGAGQGSEKMVALQAAIERPLRKLGFRGEGRRFVPHVTLGRIRHGRPPRELTTQLDALATFDAGTMAVDEVTVYASTLTPTGSEYHTLSHAPLAP